jgi:hypothetical protein
LAPAYTKGQSSQLPDVLHQAGCAPCTASGTSSLRYCKTAHLMRTAAISHPAECADLLGPGSAHWHARCTTPCNNHCWIAVSLRKALSRVVHKPSNVSSSAPTSWAERFPATGVVLNCVARMYHTDQAYLCKRLVSVIPKVVGVPGPTAPTSFSVPLLIRYRVTCCLW